MKKIFVTKFDGTKQPYERKKLLRTCLRTGLSRTKAEIVVKKVESLLYDGIRTRDILRMTLNILDKEDPSFSSKYSLRKALSDLNPKNNEFERFIELLLKERGFKTKWNKIIKGKYVEHQLDVIAEKNGTYLIEVKHHRNPHRFCGLGVILQNWARFLDICDATKQYKNIWIITNTKFSNHAKRFARGKNMLLTGWSFPKERGLERWIDKKSFYPITVLKTTRDVKNSLLRHGIMQIRQLMAEKETINYLSRRTLDNLLNQAEKLVRNV